ncbi:MAG: 30S ribosomal protein S1 [Candidatus Moraniibacteriota bacterium]|jgi:small subunit ribosomal protein S1
MTKANDLLDKIVKQVKKDTEKEQEIAKSPEETPTEETLTKSVATESGSTDMDALMDLNEVSIPRVGDVIDGTIIDISASIVLLDIGPIGTGMVIGREAKSGLAEDDKLRAGSEVTATVIDLDNDDGYIELSIREASYERAWDDLKAKKDGEETILVKMLDANKGGLMVEVNGVTGFLPVSQLSSKNYPRVEDGDKNKILELLKRLVRKELPVRIIDINQEDEKLIVSEKAAHSDIEREAISGLHVGDTISGEVSGVVDFGAFVKFTPAGAESEEDDAKLEGLIHISELAWQLIDNPREVIKVGDKTEAKIIGIDDTRISLSIKALLEDPWTKITEKYEVGKIYTGKVDKINHFGAFVYLDKDIHGLAHISEFQELYPGKKLDDKIAQKEEYQWKVLSIEPKEHRMGLVLMDDKKLEEDKTKKDAESEEKPTATKKKVVKKEADKK